VFAQSPTGLKIEYFRAFERPVLFQRDGFSLTLHQVGLPVKLLIFIHNIAPLHPGDFALKIIF
jgi:hypothetical protein